jgi:transposase
VGSIGAANPQACAPSGRREPRDVLNGLLRIFLRTGAPCWHDLPERYPPYKTCHHRRFQRWVEEGVLDEILGPWPRISRGGEGWTSRSAS